jgi:hypothetical protein
MTLGVGEGGVGYTPKFNFNLDIQYATCKIRTNLDFYKNKTVNSGLLRGTPTKHPT